MELRKPPNEDLAHLWSVELVPNVKLFMCLIYIFNEDGSVFCYGIYISNLFWFDEKLMKLIFRYRGI